MYKADTFVSSVQGLLPLANRNFDIRTAGLGSPGAAVLIVDPGAMSSDYARAVSLLASTASPIAKISTRHRRIRKNERFEDRGRQRHHPRDA